jgi:hypothetical protein
MSSSTKLRQTQTEYGGGRNIYNLAAKDQEVNLSACVDLVVEYFQKKHPELEFTRTDRLYKKDIAVELNNGYKPESDASFVQPDGGIIDVKYKNKWYPLLISEMKKQGTNNERKKEGKPKQAKGNAIERAAKNIDEFRFWCNTVLKLDYFPYLMLITGCDFVKGSTIHDRLDTFTNYKPRNENHVLSTDQPQPATIFVQEKLYTKSQVVKILKEFVSITLKHILKNKKGKNFSANNSKGIRKKSDFYETPYSLTEHLFEREDFDKNLSVCEPACGGGAIVDILNKHWTDKVFSYDQEKDFLKEKDKYDYIVTNPPFSLAQEFIQQARKVARKKFAFLLPLSYLHGKKRYDEIFTSDTYKLKTVYVFTRYPMLGDKLRKDGKYKTGMMVYAWYVFESTYTGNPIIEWIDNNADVLSKKDL